MNPTIKDIARAANVSYATVSRALNNKYGVKPETRHRIAAVAKRLTYRPNAIARGLVTRQTRTVGLILPDITNPFFPDLVKSFEDVAMRHGKEVLVANTNYDPVRAEHCARRMLHRTVDGVAIMTSEMNSRLLDDCHQQRIPLRLHRLYLLEQQFEPIKFALDLGLAMGR